jgi:hypothetical protein
MVWVLFATKPKGGYRWKLLAYTRCVFSLLY